MDFNEFINSVINDAKKAKNKISIDSGKISLDLDNIPQVNIINGDNCVVIFNEGENKEQTQWEEDQEEQDT